jgi:nicotinamidase-related amidase
MKTSLLIIDPQKDFCHCQGSLYIPGAERDMLNLATLIEKHGDIFDSIIITMDAHNPLHIGHPNFWINGSGEHPQPPTNITLNDVAMRKWVSVFENGSDASKWYYSERIMDYMQKAKVCEIWPEHCIIGSTGFSLDDNILRVVSAWERNSHVPVIRVLKGTYMFVEQFSAAHAMVKKPHDVDCRYETLMDFLKDQDHIYIGGEALSHCVKATITDFVEMWGCGDEITILGDATSCVPGFEVQTTEFLSSMSRQGVEIITTDQL